MYEDDEYMEEEEEDLDYSDREEEEVKAAQFVDGKLVTSQSTASKSGLADTTKSLSQLRLEVRNVVGTSVRDSDISSALGKSGNNVPRAINLILDNSTENNSSLIPSISTPTISAESLTNTGLGSSKGSTSKLSGRLDALLSSKKPQKAGLNQLSLGLTKSTLGTASGGIAKPLGGGLKPLLPPSSSTSSSSSVLHMAMAKMKTLDGKSTVPAVTGQAAGIKKMDMGKDSPNIKTIMDTSGRGSGASPLIRPPSLFASFWAASIVEGDGNWAKWAPAFTTIGASSDVSDVKPFQFKSPSPDDVVLQARSSKQQDIPKPDAKSDLKPDVKPSTKIEVKSDVKPESKAANEPSRKASTKEPRINIEEEMKKRGTEKSLLNLVVIGHVDAGKSTIMGHLLFLLGEVQSRTMEKYKKDSEKMKKGSFAYAWVLDATEEERSRGVTIDVAISKFETTSRRFTLLDAPGHRDFVPNMISGASQADVAMLVVDSSNGEFEAGFDLGGQTREHALLVRSLGVSQLVVAVNKLDNCNWDEARFLEVQEKLSAFLVQAGFRRDKVVYIPCSGFTGENLIKKESDSLKSWYSGETLVEALDKLEPPIRLLEKPLRMPISDFFKGGLSTGSSASVSVSGRIEAGSVQVGDMVTLMPAGESCVVKAIEILSDSVKWAAAGDNISLSVSVGNVLCDSKDPIPVSAQFRAKIVTFDIKIPLTIGVPSNGARDRYQAYFYVE
ncbi:HBS1-like protein [Phlyctochytrium planicorne]|nr:HBS1-like protein [Phlyctochytrium planicorne]